MNMKLSSRSAGFSLAELIGVVVIIGILAGGGAMMISNASKEAKLKVMMNNASEVTRLIQNIRSAGGETTSATGVSTLKSAMSAAAPAASAKSVIDALTNGVDFAPDSSLTFKLGVPTITPDNYVFVGLGWDAIVVKDPAKTEP